MDTPEQRIVGPVKKPGVLRDAWKAHA